MKIETYERGIYQIIKVQDESHTINDLSELKDLITGYIKRGKVHIAVGFCNASYIYSGAISVLINCYRMAEHHGGSLCIIEPNPSLVEILDTLNISNVIKIYESEEMLPLIGGDR
ncbi:MAG: STAS domain-containing protein [Chitinispirillaceae bacterium]|nr:STAS domain-containing protein [Chitinispirillaceae bacterium]